MKRNSLETKQLSSKLLQHCAKKRVVIYLTKQASFCIERSGAVTGSGQNPQAGSKFQETPTFTFIPTLRRCFFHCSFLTATLKVCLFLFFSFWVKCTTPELFACLQNCSHVKKFPLKVAQKELSSWLKEHACKQISIYPLSTAI